MSAPTLSVVITTYRRDDFLVEAVASLVKQTLPLHEIVVVDDGGPGSAKAALAAFGDRASYVWQPNAGVQAARNAGVAISTGEWIGFLDDDDVWEPDRHASAQPLLAGGEVDVVSSNFRMFGQGWVAERAEYERWPASFWPEPLRSGAMQIMGRFPPHRIFPTHPFWPSTLIARRAIVDAIGGWDVRMRSVITEDFHFVYRILRAGKLGLLTRPTVRYRVHAGNTVGNAHRVALSRLQVFDAILNTVDCSASERIALLEKESVLLQDARWGARQLGQREQEREIAGRMLSSTSMSWIQRVRLLLSMKIRHRSVHRKGEAKM